MDFIADNASPPELTDLQNLKFPTVQIEKRADQVRFSALKELALNLSIKQGMNWRAKQINEALEKHKLELDRTFDFRRLMLSESPTKHYDGVYLIQPPVITKTEQATNIDRLKMEIAGVHYEINQQAKFVGNPPNWRDYLIQDFERKLATPNSVLLPKNKKEKEQWKQWVEEGFQLGVEKANQVYSINRSRLTRDFEGMYLYRQLLKYKMVSLPYVAQHYRGVEGDKNELNINKVKLSISALPAMNRVAEEWEPSIYDVKKQEVLGGSDTEQ